VQQPNAVFFFEIRVLVAQYELDCFEEITFATTITANLVFFAKCRKKTKAFKSRHSF
jgi:hypothetical protein